MSLQNIALPDLLQPRTSPREIGMWVAAGALVLVIHAYAFLQAQQWDPSEPPAEEAATALMIDLAPMAVAPDAVPADMAELVESMEVPSELPPTETTEPETTPVETVTSEVIEEVAPPETEMTQAEPVETEPLDSVETERLETAEPESMEPVETEPVEPDTTTPDRAPQETVEEVIPDLVEAPLPEVAMALPTPKPDIVEAEPEPKPAPKPFAKKPVEKKPAPEKPVRKEAKKKPAQPAAAAAQASANDAPKKAAPRPTEGAKSSGESPARWQSRVNAHLNRFKRYPAGERETGQAAVRFSIDASGRVLSAALARSSGNAALDRAAVEMVRRASPVPAPPPAIAKSRMSLTVPVRFSRR